MANDASGPADDNRLFESPLTEGEKALRDRFVSEYLKDFNPYQAALRIGFLHSFALDWSKRLMSESYVQQQIATLTRTPSADPAAQEAADRALLENTYREAMQRGPYASRVAAGRAFAEMKGWAKPDNTANSEQGLIDLFRDFAQKVPV